MAFPSDEKENFLMQHCSPSQFTHACTICHRITNYAAIQHISSISWTESHETSNMIGHFVTVFWRHNQYTKFDIFPCKYVTKYHTTRRIYIVRTFFEFFTVSNLGQNDVRE